MNKCECASCKTGVVWGSRFTASEAEQHALKQAYANGAVIEAKGRDTLRVSYAWAVVEHPRWDFENNYYRVKHEIPSP